MGASGNDKAARNSCVAATCLSKIIKMIDNKTRMRKLKPGCCERVKSCLMA